MSDNAGNSLKQADAVQQRPLQRCAHVHRFLKVSESKSF
jgi:hypothetical protein